MRLNRAQSHNLHASRVWVSTWGLVLALLWAQSLGLWHGIVHGGHGVGSVHASLALAPAASDAARLGDRALCSVSPGLRPPPFTCAERSATQAFGTTSAPSSQGFFESLFGNHHDGVDCELFDQLCHGDALATAPVLVLPLGVPAAHIAHLTGLAVARWAALFQARAPPFSH